MGSAVRTSSARRTMTITLCAMFTALMVVGAFYRIPIPHLPITLQNFFAMMAGLLLGGELGAVSVAVYVLLGLLGLPVFTEGGGIFYVLKPSFGYLVAFILGAYITGKIANAKGEPSFKRILAANFIGLAVVYAIGMTYFFIAMNVWTAGASMTVKKLFAACFIPVIPGDIVKCIVAAIIAVKLIPITKRYTGGLLK